jgi:hypothetical protein
MARRWFGVLTGALSVAGCTAGSGSLATYSAGGRDDPGSTRDSPPSERDNPSGACIVCDVSYSCTGTVLANTLGGSGLQLSTSGGTCVTDLVDLICSGALFGASGCTGGGGGPFTCGNTTCSPGNGQTTTVIGPVPISATPTSGSTSSPADAG